MSDQATEQIENGNWSIVELFGRKTVAGYASKSEMLGVVMVRIDVPETSAFPAYTVMYGSGAIYGVTFVSEAVARKTAEAIRSNPVAVYVPEIITREQLDAAKAYYEDELRRLRNLLPAGTQAHLPDPDQERFGYDYDLSDDGKEEINP